MMDEAAQITAEQEKAKYEKAWKIHGYRDNSPGERLVQVFLENAKPSPGQTLVDLGCGTGRAGLKLMHNGLDVTLLDISESALDPHVRAVSMPFYEACLWDDPPAIGFDWFYCTDVMEHIPPAHVDRVLGNARLMATKGFFQIAMFDDAWGNQINEKLHLTVRGRQWWLDRISEHWQNIKEFEIEWQRICLLVS